MNEEETQSRESLRGKERVNRRTDDEAPSMGIAVGAALFPLTRSGSPQKSHARSAPSSDSSWRVRKAARGWMRLGLVLIRLQRQAWDGVAAF